MLKNSPSYRSWLLVFLFLAVLGFLVSGYALNHHMQVKIFGKTNAMCNINSYFNCDRVANSQFSEIGGIPLGAIGMGYFLSAAVVLLWGFNLGAYFLLVVAGFLSTLVLSSISYFGIKALCITCLSIYLITLSQALAFFLVWRKNRFSVINQSMLSGFLVIGAVMVVWIAGFMSSQTLLKKYLSDPRYSSALNHRLSWWIGKKPKTIPLELTPETGKVGDIWKGKKDAKVTIVEYIDLMCPSCQDFQPLMDGIEKEYGSDLLVVLKHFPRGTKCNNHAKTKLHEWACETTLASICAWQKGRYWDFQKMIFSNTDMPPLTAAPNAPKETRPRHELILKRLGFSDAEIKSCLESTAGMEKIKKDVEEGWEVGVRATPGVYINGWPFTDINSYDFLKYDVDSYMH